MISAWPVISDRIVFQGGNLEPFDHPGEPPELYTVRPDGTDLTQVTRHLTGDPWVALPDWSDWAGQPILVTLIHVDGRLTLGAVDVTSGTWSELVDSTGAAVPRAHPRTSRRRTASASADQ